MSGAARRRADVPPVPGAPDPEARKDWKRRTAELAVAALVVAIYLLLVTRGRLPDWGLW